MSSPDNESTITAMLTVIIIFIICAFCGYWLYMRLLSGRECSAMEGMYGTLNGSIRAINSVDAQCGFNLKDYYCKTAYNCCSSGSYKNDYVNLCALKAVLKQGIRCLDFEIFSIDDKPIISVSTTDDTHIKETYNQLDMFDVLTIIRDYGFSGSGAPNPTDPILLHFRFKSDNLKMYDNFAKMLEGFNSILLGSEYSYESAGGNFGDTKLLSLCGKIAIIVDRSNTTFMESKSFYEYVNMCSNSMFMRAIVYNDIKYSPDQTELREFNRKGMTIALPDVGPNPPNISGTMLRELGVQFQAMRYQQFDDALEENELWFDAKTYAFALKPEELRDIPVVIADPKKPDPALSYENRVIASDYYKFTI